MVSTEENVAGVYDGWPPEARSMVQKAIASHGGLDVWQTTRKISLSFRAVSGILPWLKGYGHTFAAPQVCDVWPHDHVTIFRRYPDAQHQGRFAEGVVSIERIADGRAVLTSPHHRDTFRGLKKGRRWNDLDALYFFGYALSHYHALPFTLGQARFVKLVRQRTLQGVEVDFPAGVQTHCRRQRFFFRDDGTIARHDYVAEVIGKWARGCHMWEDYRTVGGLQVACRRRVVARLFGRPTSMTVLQVDLDADDALQIERSETSVVQPADEG